MCADKGLKTFPKTPPSSISRYRDVEQVLFPQMRETTLHTWLERWIKYAKSTKCVLHGEIHVRPRFSALGLHL